MKKVEVLVDYKKPRKAKSGELKALTLEIKKLVKSKLKNKKRLRIYSNRLRSAANHNHIFTNTGVPLSYTVYNPKFPDRLALVFGIGHYRYRYIKFNLALAKLYLETIIRINKKEPYYIN